MTRETMNNQNNDTRPEAKLEFRSIFGYIGAAEKALKATGRESEIAQMTEEVRSSKSDQDSISVMGRYVRFVN